MNLTTHLVPPIVKAPRRDLGFMISHSVTHAGASVTALQRASLVIDTAVDIIAAGIDWLAAHPHLHPRPQSHPHA